MPKQNNLYSPPITKPNSHLLESDLGSIGAEALAAHHDTILADETVVVTAGAATIKNIRKGTLPYEKYKKNFHQCECKSSNIDHGCVTKLLSFLFPSLKLSTESLCF